MTDKTDNDNVTETVAPAKPTFRVLTGGKEFEAATPIAPEQTEPDFPQNDYVIVDYDDNQHFATGFLVFTSQHVAVMQEREDGNALPILVLPLGNVKFAQLYNPAEDVQVELPL